MKVNVLRFKQTSFSQEWRRKVLPLIESSILGKELKGLVDEGDRSKDE